MWILDQTKTSIINADKLESIIIFPDKKTISGFDYKPNEYDQASFVTLGKYETERALRVFKLLANSIQRGDKLFKMPEK